MIEEMIRIAREVQQNAHVPYSHFRVGACVQSEDGRLFGGCNVENAAWTGTHAEAVAICNLIGAGQKRVMEIVIIGTGGGPCPPCGACRQMIREFAAPDAKIHLCSSDKVLRTFTLAELLPESFGPENLI